MMLLLCGALWGMGEWKRDAEHIRQLEALCGLIRYVRERIEYFSQPVGEMFRDFRSEVLEKCGFCGILKKYGLSAALFENRLLIDDAEAKLMTDFAHALGGSFRDEEIKMCNFYLTGLESCLTLRRKSFSEKSTLTRTLPLIIAAVAVILLI